MRQRIDQLVAWGTRLGLEYTRTRASLAAGGLAYFVALSLAPAALAFGTLAGLVLDPDEVRAVLERLTGRAPDAAGELQPAVDALVSLVEGASASAVSVTAIISAVIAIYASSKVVYGLRMALNTIFGATEERGGLIERGISAVITLVGMVLAVAAVIVLTLVPRVLDWLGVPDVTLTTGSWLADWVVVIAVVFVSTRLILKHGPNGGQRVPWLALGPWTATAGIVAVTIGVGVYARFSTSLGAAVLLFGTAVVILLWLYLCFVALLWGAIIEADRQAGATRRTSAVVPPPGR